MASPKKPIKRQQVARLADPATYAAADAAAKADDAIFGARIATVFEEIKTLTAGRHPRTLTGQDAVTLMALMAEFNKLSIEQKRFVEADMASRLDPGDGSDGPSVRPLVPSDFSHA